MKNNIKISPSRKRATIFSAVGGYVNTAIAITQGLLLLPMYLQYLGANTYGYWLASGGMLGMLGMINFGISSLVIQRIARAYGQKDLRQAGAYFINGLVVYSGICLLYGLAGLGVSSWLPEILNISGGDAELLRHCFQLAVLAMTISILNECLRSFAQALLRPVVPMVGMATGRILGLFGIVWMLYSDFGLWALPCGALIAEGTIFIVNLFYAVSLFRSLGARMKLDRNIMKEYFKTSPALLIARVGDTLSQESEPLLIAIFFSPEMTTAYMVTRRAAEIVFRILNVVVGSTMGSFAHLSSCANNEKISRVAKKLLFISFYGGAIGFASYVGANHIFVTLWVGEQFALAPGVIFFIAFGFFARTLRGLLSQMLYGLNDFYNTSVVVLLEGVARIALAVGLLSLFGIIGVPLAFALSCLIATLVLAFRLKSRLAMNFNFIAIARFLFTGVLLFWGASILGQVTFGFNSWNYFALHLLMLLASVVMVYAVVNWPKCCNLYRNILK